ncbi:MAG TPA: sugar nucleotide-binding protein [Solirubrobacteraceae bacterium]|jgi:dTDP-4-dehydrorhamnose reductase
MRLLITGASGLVGSNLAAAAVQQSWEVLGTYHEHPVDVTGARTESLDVADRHACVEAASGFEPDVFVHAAGSFDPSRLEHEPYAAQLAQLGVEHTLAAARSVRASYVLVSCDSVFSGLRPPEQRWSEDDEPDPLNALGRSKRAAEDAVRRYNGSWLITRPAEVYGVNMSRPREGELAEHVWRHSSIALQLVSRLRSAQPLPAPADGYRSPTYAWDYAQRVCELIAQDCEGVYNTAGPESLNQREYLRLLARAFDCDPALVREGTVAGFLRACGEDPQLKLAPNTALSDDKASFVLGHPAVDARTGHRLMRSRLREVLGADPARAVTI